MINCNTAGTLHAQTDLKWSVATVLPSRDGKTKQAGLAGPVVGLINDQLFVSGGANFEDGMPWRGAKKIYHDEIYLLKRNADGSISSLLHRQRLPQTVAYCATVSTPHGLVYIGGENENGISDSVVLIKYYSPNGSFIFDELPSLPAKRTNLSAAFVNGVIYAGGGNGIDGTSDKFFSLDLSVTHPVWKEIAKFPEPTAYAVMAAQSTADRLSVYLVGGRKKTSNGLSEIFSSIYEYDIKADRWIQKRSMPYALSAGTGVFIVKDQLMIIGGDKGETFSKEEKLNLQISSATDPQKKQEMTGQKILLLESHPGFTNDVLIYNAIADRWEKGDGLPGNSPVTTTAINWDGDVIIPSGEIKAGVRTPNVLTGRRK